MGCRGRHLPSPLMLKYKCYVISSAIDARDRLAQAGEAVKVREMVEQCRENMILVTSPRSGEFTVAFVSDWARVQGKLFRAKRPLLLRLVVTYPTVVAVFKHVIAPVGPIVKTLP